MQFPHFFLPSPLVLICCSIHSQTCQQNFHSSWCLLLGWIFADVFWVVSPLSLWEYLLIFCPHHNGYLYWLFLAVVFFFFFFFLPKTYWCYGVCRFPLPSSLSERCIVLVFSYIFLVSLYGFRRRNMKMWLPPHYHQLCHLAFLVL